jgi:hypothetical protein
MNKLTTCRCCPNRALLVCLLLAGLVLPGCATPPKTTLHAQDTILGRHLYDTEPAFIYASSQAAADEAGVDLAIAIRDYRKATGHSPTGKALLVVTDKNDTPYADRHTVLRMGKRVEDMQKFGGPSTRPADLEEKLRKAEETFGPEALDKLFLTKPATTDNADAIRLWALANRPAASASWVLAVPTGELARQAMHLAIEKAMAKKEASAVARVLVAPLLLLIEGKARQAVQADRQVAVFLMLACKDAALDAPARKAVFQKYQRAKEQDVMQDMPMPDGMKKSPAASRPSVQLPGSEPAGATPSTRSSE